MPPRLYAPHQQVMQCSRRCFTTTTNLHAQTRVSPLKLLPKDAAPPPPYPYGAAQWYKQSDHGLYGGAMIQFGNNVAPKSGVKTRRQWDPNVVYKKLFSHALGRPLRLRVRTRVLRTIDKVGGLDEYLLGSTSARLKELGEEGWKLRWAILQTSSIKKRLKVDAKLRHAVGDLAAINASPQVVAVETDLPLAEAVADASSPQDVEEAVAEQQFESAPATEAQREEQINVEERIRQHLENTHMREEPPPQSTWQRFTSLFSRRGR